VYAPLSNADLTPKWKSGISTGYDGAKWYISHNCALNVIFKLENGF
jgi:hypothetical protein